jgi:hypothetical protein
MVGVDVADNLRRGGEPLGKMALIVLLLAAEGAGLVAYLPREDCGVIDIFYACIAICAAYDKTNVVIENLLGALVAYKLAGKGVI